MSGAEPASSLTPKERVDAYLTLYQQQMARYDKLQNVEWKGTFGAWTLMAAAAYLVLQRELQLGSWAAAGLVVAGIHSLWLLGIYNSEEFDKALWTRYRAAVLGILEGDVEETVPGERIYAARSRAKELRWLALESGVTWCLALLVLFRGY